jgi:TfoX/Sxy family transcriptional regulator of competence genes
MAINEKLTNRVRECLAATDKVTEKKMFSGIAFLVDEKLCIAVRNDNIMLRIDPLWHDDLVEQDGCSSMVMRGKDLEGYVVVEERVLDTKKQLRYWLKLALDYNPIAQRSKKKKQGRRKA